VTTPQRSRPRSPGLYAGKPFGIPLFVAPSWFLIAALSTYLVGQYLSDQNDISETTAYVGGALFVVLLYLSVLVHELAHSLVARTLGLPVRRIVLLIIGGVSELEREPETPGREYLVALAGPLVSLFLAGVALAISGALPSDSTSQVVLAEVGVANGFLAGFNMLPGLPLDGGRVFRAAVWWKTRDPMRATVAAAWAGRILAIAIVIAPVYVASISTSDHRPGSSAVIYAIVIGSFLWMGASQSLQLAEIRRRLPLITVRGLARRAITVPADLPLAEALRRAYEIGARGLVTVDSSGRVSGVVSEAAVAATPEHRRPWVLVGNLARRFEPSLVVDIDLTGQQVLDVLGSHPASEYVVLDGGGDVWGVLATSDVVHAVATRPS
jgi:Zn-dependent protease/CBS domain-containing protein